MRLKSVTIEGLRSIERAEIRILPVTFFTGPNGAGKTAAVGAVAYALTGRFPGLQAVHPGELLALASDRSRGFLVKLETDTGTTVERGVSVNGRPENHLIVVHGRRSKGPKDADQLLHQAFGDVSWFVDAFDPERSLWRLSGEKRKEWALNLCAGSSGWTRERFVREIGTQTDDWDPTIGRDAGNCLEINLDTLHDKVLGLQKLAREANTVAEGVTVGEELATVTRLVDERDAQYVAIQQRVTHLERLLADSKGQQATIETTRRERARLTKAIETARTELGALLPPAPPRPSPDAAKLEAKGTEQFALQMELESAEQDQVAAAAEWAAACEALKRAETDARQIEETHACPVCGTATPDASAAQVRVGAALARRDRAHVQKQLADAQADRCAEQAARLQEELTMLGTAAALHLHDVDSFDERKRAFDGTWETLMRNVQSLEEQLGRLPADRADLTTAELEHDLETAKEVATKAKAELAQARADQGVARERAGQRKAAADAKERIVVVQALLEKMRTVRDRMLDDAVRPLSDALARLRALAPAGGVWGILRQGKTIDIVLAKVGAEPLPVTSLSAGEKMRGTLALLIARSIVRREPWVGLFVDNFEQIHPVVERAEVLRALVNAAESGHIDNALVAGACDPLPPVLHISGMHTYVGGDPPDHVRTGT